MPTIEVYDEAAGGVLVSRTETPSDQATDPLATLAERVTAVDARVDRVPQLAVIAVEAALDAAASMASGATVEEAKAAAVQAVTDAIGA